MRLARSPDAVSGVCEEPASALSAHAESDAVSGVCEELVPRAPALSAHAESFVYAVSSAIQNSYPNSAAIRIEQANWPWIRDSEYVSRHLSTMTN